MARITGNVQPTIALAEHDDTGGVNTKKALMYGWDSSGLTKVRVKVDSDGVVQTAGSGGGSVTQGTTPWIIGDAGATINLDASGDVQVDVLTMPTVAVTGTFWQATQPVSGTFWQTTQPISGTVTANLGTIGDVATQTTLAAILAGQLPDSHNVTVDNASIAVTGTFYQATQPVSIATMPSTPVTGTFWQATQPVSATNLDIRDLTATDIVTAVHGITGIGHGVKTVTTAGTDEALAGSTVCKRVTIQAQTDNTTAIAVGASGVDATVATGTGILLFPGDSFELEIDNLADVFIDALTDGEGVRYVYFS